ncbi:MAG: DMT family transporter [Betaproteobacteria bacterium]|nr:DMT family transporter [Betaproteobacteria bacterium]MDH5222645.1 DMT family transporter [Betaproteobacteria bacterium]MDH5351633.1 DMT family transporter [Betaproteobacteria bacterium]
MLVLTALWGFQQVAIKLAAPDVSLVMQAALRTFLAAGLLLAWARWRGIALFSRDGTLAAGLGAGLLFGGEFVFVYAGLEHTAASRMVVFIYLAPIVTALGVHWLVPGEHLSRTQWAGVLLAFGGVALAFGEGFLAARGATLLGDLFGVVAAVLWGLTTVLIRASRLGHASAEKTLFYQLGVSAPLLLAASLAMGERGVVDLTPFALASLAYQGAIVAFASYLAWFWLLTRYLAGRLAVFSFMTPLFGVLAGVAVLGEPLRPAFAGAALLVGAGIVLVNRR